MGFISEKKKTKQKKKLVKSVVAQWHKARKIMIIAQLLAVAQRLTFQLVFGTIIPIELSNRLFSSRNQIYLYQRISVVHELFTISNSFSMKNKKMIIIIIFSLYRAYSIKNLFDVITISFLNFIKQVNNFQGINKMFFSRKFSLDCFTVV